MISRKDVLTEGSLTQIENNNRAWEVWCEAQLPSTPWDR